MSVAWLPLEAFDDTEYDSRLPQEWIEYGRQGDGTFNPIPGQGLKMLDKATGSRLWCKVLIVEYDEEKEEFVGRWDDEKGDRCTLTRINLLFNAEDPRIFA